MLIVRMSKPLYELIFEIWDKVKLVNNYLAVNFEYLFGSTYFSSRRELIILLYLVTLQILQFFFDTFSLMAAIDRIIDCFVV